MNVPKLVLYGAGVSVGLLGLAVLVGAVIALDCAKRAGWR